MLFVLANAYLEGLLPAHSFFCIYPGSKRGTVSEKLKGYLDKAAKLFHGYYREDLLIRACDAPDTSIERWRARQTGSEADVSIATQATTVHIGDNYRDKLNGKNVVVFDDFTTQGMSLEWARIMLSAAGAGRIVLLTVGKYRNSHTHYELKEGISFNPFGINVELTSDDFVEVEQYPGVDRDVSRYFYDVISAEMAE